MSQRVAIYGGSFNPPGLHHRKIAEHLCDHVDKVIVVPCGPRPDKFATNEVDPVHRATMIDLNFRGLPKVEADLFDLEESTFTRTWDLDLRYHDHGDLWHAI